MPPGGLEKVDMVQADGTALPFHHGIFDRYLAAGVYMHVPTAAMRNSFLSEGSRILAPRDGLAVITGRGFSLYYRWLGYKKEDWSRSGISLFSSTKREFVSLLEKHFEVNRCVGIKFQIPKVTRYIGQPIVFDRVMQFVPFSSVFAGAFVAQCKKREI